MPRFEKRKITIAAINIQIVRNQFLSMPALIVEQSSQFQEAENRQTKPEIYQGSEIKLVSVMPGGFRQVGIEGEIQAVAKNNGN